jgi:ferredoxin-NADP reductase
VGDALTLSVRELIDETPYTRILRLDLDHDRFTYRAGQAAVIGAHGQPLRRPYSIATAPEESRDERYLDFLLRADAGGRLGPHLPNVGPGSRVDLEGPYGSFVFPVDVEEEHLLFIAGGTGIAPLRAMLWHVLLTNRASAISLLYSARSPDDFSYERELRDLADRGRIRLDLTVTRSAAEEWRGARGRIDRRRLAAFITDPATLCFLCGPHSLITEVPPLLRQLGIADARIRVEEW